MNKTFALAMFGLLASCEAGQPPIDSARMSAARANEPPIKCEFSRGDWCFLKKGYIAKTSRAEHGGYHVYWIAEDYWANEAGVVLESPGCTHGYASYAAIEGQDPRFTWQNAEWRMVEISFGRASTCTLKLLAPLKRAAPLDMAASVLSANVAYCDRIKECLPKVAADAIYGAFQQMAESEKQGSE